MRHGLSSVGFGPTWNVGRKSQNAEEMIKEVEIVFWLFLYACSIRYTCCAEIELSISYMVPVKRYANKVICVYWRIGCWAIEDCVKIVSNGKISLSTVYRITLFKEVIVIDWKDSSPIWFWCIALLFVLTCKWVFIYVNKVHNVCSAVEGQLNVQLFGIGKEGVCMQCRHLYEYWIIIRTFA